MLCRLPKLEHRIQQAHGRRRRQHYSSSSSTSGSFNGSTNSISELKANGDAVYSSNHSSSSSSSSYGDTEVLAMAFVGSRGLLATAGNDGIVRCWCFASRQLAAELSVVS
jgi:hypothetical protein